MDVRSRGHLRTKNFNHNNIHQTIRKKKKKKKRFSTLPATEQSIFCEDRSDWFWSSNKGVLPCFMIKSRLCHWFCLNWYKRPGWLGVKPSYLLIHFKWFGGVESKSIGHILSIKNIVYKWTNSKWPRRRVKKSGLLNKVLKLCHGRCHHCHERIHLSTSVA